MKLKFSLLILIAVMTAISMKAEQSKATSAEDAALLQLDQKWQQAVVDGNQEFLEKNTASDFSFMHWGKDVADSKADWIQWATQKPHHFLARKVSDQSVEIHGDAALVFGRSDVRTLGDHPGAPDRCYAVAYVHLYGLRNGQWMFLSHRSTGSLEPVHACAPGEDK